MPVLGDIAILAQDSRDIPAAVPADRQMLARDARAAEADPPPVDATDYEGFLHAAAAGQPGAEQLQAFTDMLACAGAVPLPGPLACP